MSTEAVNLFEACNLVANPPMSERQVQRIPECAAAHFHALLWQMQESSTTSLPMLGQLGAACQFLLLLQDNSKVKAIGKV